MANWDNEIDEVARRMTDGEPGASFRTQVLDRIDSVGPRRRLRSSVWTWSPIAVAAAAGLVLTIVRPSWNAERVRLKPDPVYAPAQSGATDAVADATGEGSSRAASSSDSRVPSDVVSGLGQTADRSPGVAPTGAAALLPRDRTTRTTDATARVDRIETLEPSPILVAPLAAAAMETLESIQVPGLEVAPLGVQRLAVARLDVPAMGDE